MSNPAPSPVLAAPHIAASLTDLPRAQAGSLQMHIATKGASGRATSESMLSDVVARLGAIAGSWHVEAEFDNWFGRQGDPTLPTWLGADTYGTLWLTPRFTDPADLAERRAAGIELINGLVVGPVSELGLLGLADWVARPTINAELRDLAKINYAGTKASFARRADSFDAIRDARRVTLDPWLAGAFAVNGDLATFRLVHAEASPARAYAIAVLAHGGTINLDPTDPAVSEAVAGLLADGLAELRQSSYGATYEFVRRSRRLARRLPAGNVLSFPGY